MKICTLFLRVIFSLFNLMIFGFFVCLNYFIDQENKYIFKWILGNHTTHFVYSLYSVPLLPTWWMKYLHYTLFAWQGLWMVYGVAILFKKKFPDAMNLFFYTLIISSSGLEIAWIIYLSRNIILPACVAIFCAAFLKSFALVLAYVRFDYEFEHEEHTFWDFCGFQFLIFNGLASYVVVAWFNSLVWLSIVLTYKGDVPEVSATTISLTFAFTSVIIWFILENLAFLWISRFALSIYPVSIVTLTASLVDNWNPSSRNSILLAVLLGLVGLFFVLHITRVTLRLVRARRSYSTRKTTKPESALDIEFLTTRF